MKLNINTKDNVENLLENTLKISFIDSENKITELCVSLDNNVDFKKLHTSVLELVLEEVLNNKY